MAQCVYLGRDMKDDQHRFLSVVGQFPARLTVEQTAWMLNCQPHDVPILVSTRLLKPLGNPPPNGIKFFATVDVLDALKDRSWLARMTNSITQHWQRKNENKKPPAYENARNGHASLQPVKN